ELHQHSSLLRLLSRHGAGCRRFADVAPDGIEYREARAWSHRWIQYAVLHRGHHGWRRQARWTFLRALRSRNRHRSLHESERETGRLLSLLRSVTHSRRKATAALASGGRAEVDD